MEALRLRVVVIGAGRIGAQVARELHEQGAEVVVTTKNPQTTRAMECLGIPVMSWRWDPGVSWEELCSFEADVWFVTVPPRGGQERAELFHRELNEAAQHTRVPKLIWTSSTAVYPPQQSGEIREGDAGHHSSRHTGVDMLALEEIHRSAQPGFAFVAMRFGGLFSQSRHPLSALLKRRPVQSADGHVQWLHEDDAVGACVRTICFARELPQAINVVAPQHATRRMLLEAGFESNRLPAMLDGGVERRVKPDVLDNLGMTWKEPSPVDWVRRHPGTTEDGCWHGPHGPLSWTRHRVVGAHRKGIILMVHGYKGFRRWGNWYGVAHNLVEAGWEVVRLDFSHNGHLTPFDEDCLDEEAWSANRYHMEVNEVEFGLAQLSKESGEPLVVLGHSRGGAIAALGAAQHQRNGGKLSGVSMWSPVSDLFSRFPSGKELDEWEARGFIEVVNGRTGQVLRHPFDFFVESQSRKAMLDVQIAIRSLSCDILVVHGDSDEVVMPFEGKRIAGWAKSGTYERIEGGNHVFGMSHPWHEACEQTPALIAALRAQNQWLNHLHSSAGVE